MIGSRTVTSLILFCVAVLAALLRGRLSLSYLASLEPRAAFVGGLFACIAGSLFFAYWQLSERSGTFLELTSPRRLSSDELLVLDFKKRQLVLGRVMHRIPFDLPPFMQRVLYVWVFLCLGLIAFDNRTTEILVNVPSEIDLAGSKFCEDEKKPVEQTPADEIPGCKLVVRAFQLGFIKSLGSCDPQKSSGKPRTVCDKRRRDEPALHYMWRELGSDLSKAGEFLGDGPSFAARFATQVEYIEPRLGMETDAVAASPRASHHIWTNLPHPRGFFSRLLEWFDPRSCAERARKPRDFLGRAGSRSPSDLFEQALAQLVYASRYRPVGGFCQEYHIHWDAPTDACQRFAGAPFSLLEDDGADEAVLSVVERWQNQVALSELSEVLGREGLRTRAEKEREQRVSARRPRNASAFVSFQCLMVTPNGQGGATDLSATLLGQKFQVRSVTVNSASLNAAAVFQATASMLSPDFKYGRFQSSEGAVTEPHTVVNQEQLQPSLFLLSQLEFLADADLFLGHDWLFARNDLLEVYPYHVHLKNFVEVFRRQYVVMRGRL